MYYTQHFVQTLLCFSWTLYNPLLLQSQLFILRPNIDKNDWKGTATPVPAPPKHKPCIAGSTSLYLARACIKTNYCRAKHYPFNQINYLKNSKKKKNKNKAVNIYFCSSFDRNMTNLCIYYWSDKWLKRTYECMMLTHAASSASSCHYSFLLVQRKKERLPSLHDSFNNITQLNNSLNPIICLVADIVNTGWELYAKTI